MEKILFAKRNLLIIYQKCVTVGKTDQVGVHGDLWGDQGGMKREPASPGGPGGVPGYSFGGHLGVLSGQFRLS